MKLSVNKEKLTGLWARNYATILQVLILKFSFGLRNFEKWAPDLLLSCTGHQILQIKSTFEVFFA